MVCRYLGFEPFFGVLSQDIGSVALTPHSISVDVECRIEIRFSSLKADPMVELRARLRIAHIVRMPFADECCLIACILQMLGEERYVVRFCVLVIDDTVFMSVLSGEY